MEVRAEPVEALVAGHDGLDVVRQLVRQAPRFVKPGGWLCMEFGAEQQTRVDQLLRRRGFRQLRFQSDLAGKPRVVAAKRE